MCGIFGYLSQSDSKDRLIAEKLFKNLNILSESRGKEASGLIALTDKKIKFLKDAIPASDLIKTLNFNKTIKETVNKNENIAIFGHSRLVTNGSASDNFNNQPISVDGLVGVHNGIITNCEQLVKVHDDFKRETELDTEVLLKVLYREIKLSDIINGFAKTLKAIEGVVNIAVLFKDLNIAALSTNNGSIYYCKSNSKDSIIFASEKYILQECLKKNKLTNFFSINDIKKINPNYLLLIDLNTFKIVSTDLSSYGKQKIEIKKKNRDLEDVTTNSLLSKNKKNNIINRDYENEIKYFYHEYLKNREAISSLKRCSLCILTEKMPFIIFDQYGVCNYCKNYRPQKIRGINKLQDLFKTSKNDLDCLVTLSGGRDSSFGLHVIKKILGLNPIAYTYDWGMVTDLARRNQMRMCGKLGVEHILVSADIIKKRQSIKKNVSAWLKKPTLGMVPLFMAGDKQYFYWANRIAKQSKLKKIIMSENLLETTKFKSGFTGIKPTFGTDNTYTLTLRNKFEMLFYYSKKFIENPAYLNTSLLDTFSGFLSYYALEHNYINLFDYIKWDESEINNTLIHEYNWETSKDSNSTWRIGDGTASFYNYIYYTIAGLTENDTFRSNQIRENQMSRNDALELSIKDNTPQFENINWYLNTIELDFVKTLKVINNAKKLY